MAVLSKEERISMSKKIVQIPEQNANIKKTKDQIKKQQQQAIKDDNVNKALQNQYDQVINKYQKEYNHIDAKLRTELTESIIDSAARQQKGNGFFQADDTNPLPSLPSGVWLYFPPMGFTYAIGKDKNENFGTEPIAEEPVLPEIESLLNRVESFIPPTRATGDKCETTTTNDGGGGTTSSDELVDDTDIEELLSQLKQKIEEWELVLNQQKNAIVLPEPVADREVENQAAFDDITQLLQTIDSWQATQDFDTTTKLNEEQKEEYCVIFNAYEFEFFQDNKLSDSQIGILKQALKERSAFLTKRKEQLNRYFGEVVQDLNTGELKSFSGWYGERYLLLDSRLNLLSGTANKKFGAEKVIETQDQIKSSNETTGAAYGLTMKVSKVAAPAIGTEYLNLLDASEFEVGDDVFVVADSQEELSGKILDKTSNRIKLNFKVPKKYTLANSTRVYKVADKNI